MRGRVGGKRVWSQNRHWVWFCFRGKETKTIDPGRQRCNNRGPASLYRAVERGRHNFLRVRSWRQCSGDIALISKSEPNDIELTPGKAHTLGTRYGRLDGWKFPGQKKVPKAVSIEETLIFGLLSISDRLTLNLEGIFPSSWKLTVEAMWFVMISTSFFSSSTVYL